MQLSAREWLSSTCQASAPGLPTLVSWQLSADASVAFELENGRVELSARSADDHPSWCRLEHVALNVTCTPDPAPEPVQRFLRSLRTALLRADPGPIEFAPAASSEPVRERRHRRSVSPALARELNEAAFVACRILDAEPRILPTIQRHDGHVASTWRTMVLEEFYPYMGALGVPLGEAEILDGWARTAESIRRGAAPEGVDLYVHVPFCTTQCRFCYCAVTTSLSTARFESYVDHVVGSLRRAGAVLGDTPVRTVFVGGGTPSLLPPRLMERLFGAMHESFVIPPSTQITVETNPDSLTRDRLEVLVRVGRMNRLTVGIQTLDPEAQKRIDRYNDADRIRKMIDAARELGVRQLNVDVIAGLDGQSVEAFEADVRFALSLEPDSFHLSSFRPVRAERFEADPEQVERRRTMMEWGVATLAEHGLEYRKNLPATRSGDAVNEQIFRFHELSSSLLGIGASAYSHSFGGHCYEMPFHLEPTLLQIGRGEPAQYQGLSSAGDEEMHRFLVHAFFQQGFPLDRFRSLFGREPWDAVPEAWQRFEDLGVVRRDSETVRFDASRHADIAVLRVLLYGPVVKERVHSLWSADYDRSVDYRARIDAICGDL